MPPVNPSPIDFDDQLAAINASRSLTRENVETLISLATAKYKDPDENCDLNDYYDDMRDIIELIQDKNLSYSDLNALDRNAKENLLKTVFRREVELDDIDITDPDDLVNQNPFSFFVYKQIENYTAQTKDDYLDLSVFCFADTDDFEVECENSDEEFETKNIKDFAKARLNPDRFYTEILQSNNVQDFKTLLRSDKLTFDPTKIAHLAEKPKLLNELYKSRYKDNKDEFVDLLKAITRLETKSAYAIRENLNDHYREMDKDLLDIVNENLRSQADQQAIDNAQVKYKKLVGEKKDLVDQINDNKPSKPSLNPEDKSLSSNKYSIISLAIIGFLVASTMLPTLGLSGPLLIACSIGCGLGGGACGYGIGLGMTAWENQGLNSTKTQYEQDKLMEKFEAKEAEVKKAKKVLDELEAPYKKSESISAPDTPMPIGSRSSEIGA